jgi:hypothetical protein
MSLYAAKLKGSAKKITKKTDLEVEPVEPVVDKKQAAKLARQEKARLKKEELVRQENEAKAALEAKELELKQAEEALIAKKEAQKEKRRLARQAKKQTPTPPESIATEVTLQEKPTRKRKRAQPTIEEQVDEEVGKLESQNEEPPAWFKKYVAGVKHEEREMQEPPKKPKKEVAKEADEMAQKQWGNGLVRDRVRNEVDKHMSRMYQMIFNRNSFDGL